MVMALEFEQQHQQLSLTTNPVDGDTNGVDAAAGRASAEAGDDSSKAPRLPRWTRQEILVLIKGKRAAESRGGGGRTARSEFGSGQAEPKWAAVSSYCKKHGVNRGPVQCRKRWSNLAGDFKKIREWEAQRKDETESFWVMRNDLRRERKLPGFFDKEVYDIMEAVSGAGAPVTLALAPPPLMVSEAENNLKEGLTDEVEKLFDSRQGPTDDGLFSDYEQEESGRSPDKEVRLKSPTAIPAPLPISEKLFKPIQASQGQGAAGQKQPPSIPEMGSTSQDRKRKRFAIDGEEETFSLQNQLIEVMERNGKMLADYFEAQNSHSQLDREQRKEHSDSLIAVLNKLADAFMRIADKL
ncbi:putative transcription factor MYB family [Rosa chinensis]|uniref:Putative transcription factor MYB family n=1 Tax=Rosa chinensis TaxID=74649 RepID=A0A2P6R018_ROSCH|nr:trihelix transcription factor ASR3 isoform X1 [Rosa chinensis]PRQ39778.1 putative transcription factor MYB family [Rosa chinensis]